MTSGIFKRLGNRPLVWICMAALTLPASAAPYPKEGLSTEWRQPDGARLHLRIFGDEFYGRTTTDDGYTVLFNEADRTYYYATQAADKTLVESTISADEVAPQGLPKHLTESIERIAAKRSATIEKYTPERAKDWRAKMDDPAKAVVTGSKVGLTILVQFPDDSSTGPNDPTNFPLTKAKMERLCNEVGYSDDGNSGSIRDYFSDQSLGQLIHTQLVSAIVTLPNPRDYYNYTNFPTNSNLRDAGEAGRLLVTHALTKLKNDGFDFSSLSTDASNRVIATSLLFAGNDSGAWSKGLWPHAYNLASNFDVGSGGVTKNVYKYQCTNVPTSAAVIGTICHELGHLLLGYPDLYDTNSADGYSEGVGEHCLMGSANYLNGGKTPAPIDLYLKNVSGWATITDITASQAVSANLPSTGNVGYRIRKPGVSTEYFLIENRGAGDKWANFCKDKGIAIWHIDEAKSGNGQQQMTSSAHYQVSIEQADGRFDLENGDNRGDANDFFESSTNEFDDYSNPNAYWWNGVDSGISIKVLSAPGASMSVQFGAPAGTTNLGVSPGTLVVTASSGNQSLSINSNSTWTWAGAPSWLKSTEASSQTGRQTFDYSLLANTTPNSRIAVLTFTAGSITRTHTVTQAGTIADDHGNTTGTATLVGMNSTTGGRFEKANDLDMFRINVNGAGTLVVRSTGYTDTVGGLLSSTGALIASNDDTAGINFQITRSIAGPGIYYVRVQNYYSGETGDYQFVSSFTPSSALSVAPDVQVIPQAGGSGTFTISTANSFSWSKTSGATWLTSSEATTQSGSQVFSYNVAANSGGPRSAVITISTGSFQATHTINQAGIPYPDLVDPEERTRLIPDVIVSGGKMKIEGDVRNAGGAASGSFVVRFYLSKNSAITTSDTVIGEITIPGLAAGGTAPIDTIVSLPALTQTTHWFGWMYDAGNTVTEESEANNLVGLTIEMPREDPVLTVSAATAAFDGASGSGSFSTTSNSAWTWASNAAWLTSYADSVQMGDQSIDYFVAANPTTTSRTGIITLQCGSLSRTHTVTQGPKPIPLVVTAFQKSGDQVSLGFQSEVGKTYRVMTSVNLETWALVPGQSGIAGTGLAISRSLAGMGIPPVEGKRFFRVEKE